MHSISKVELYKLHLFLNSFDPWRWQAQAMYQVLVSTLVNFQRGCLQDVQHGEVYRHSVVTISCLLASWDAVCQIPGMLYSIDVLAEV